MVLSFVDKLVDDLSKTTYYSQLKKLKNQNYNIYLFLVFS